MADGQRPAQPTTMACVTSFLETEQSGLHESRATIWADHGTGCGMPPGLPHGGMECETHPSRHVSCPATSSAPARCVAHTSIAPKLGPRTSHRAVALRATYTPQPPPCPPHHMPQKTNKHFGHQCKGQSSSRPAVLAPTCRDTQGSPPCRVAARRSSVTPALPHAAPCAPRQCRPCPLCRALPACSVIEWFVGPCHHARAPAAASTRSPRDARASPCEPDLTPSPGRSRRTVRFLRCWAGPLSQAKWRTSTSGTV